MQTILVTVDALRADHLGQYGYDRDPMPVLDRFETAGTRFEAAYANGPYTRVSIPALHTSRYLGYENFDSLPTIASRLSEAAVTTAFIGTQAGFAGYKDEVFDTYQHFGRDEFHEQANQAESASDVLRTSIQNAGEKIKPVLTKNDYLYAAVERPYLVVKKILGTGFAYQGYTDAETVTDAALEWLEAHRTDDFFLWIHYMEGHRPYGVHDTEPGFVDSPVDEEVIKDLMESAGTDPDTTTIAEHKLLADLYDSDLRYCSRHMERLVDGLERLDVWGDAGIIFTSDHGEEFYEHEQYFHRNLPFDELIHVPLYVKAPGGTPDVESGQRELIDIGPTICSFHDVEPPETFLGTDLFSGESRDVVSIGSQLYPDSEVVCGRWNGFKYMHVEGESFLYDLTADPREQRSIAEARTEIVKAFETSIPDRLYRSEGARLREPTDHVDRERLEALGYLELEE